MTVFFYIFLSLLMFDIVRLVLFFCRKSALTPRFTFTGTAIALGLSLVVILYGAINVRSIRTVNYNVSLSGQGNDIRIVLISDTHIGSTIDQGWIARVVDTVNRAQPDMVCIAGDIFDGNLDAVKDTDGIASQFRRINAPLGVYACLGNHDVDRISISGGGGNERIINFLKEAGIVPLEDEAVLVGESFYVIGRRDVRPIGMNSVRKTAAELLSDLDRERAVIVLDHQPTQFVQLEEAGADLLLSGHTHGGQVFPANLITRSIFKKAGGTHYGYWQGRTMQALVTSGAGFWGPPLRVGTRSEVVVIDVGFFPAL
ncbi:MAG: metallophosphoesterase [Treponema sp.]|nr:metallophosphoesterase [Treponema sp.]